VSRLRNYLPATSLDAVRLVALILAATTILALVWRSDPDQSATRQWAGVIGGAILLTDLIGTYFGGRLRQSDDAPVALIEPLIVGPAVVAVGLAARDPLTVVGACIAIAAAQALYGGGIATVIRTAILVVAVPATAAIAPVSFGQQIPWNSGVVLGLLPAVILVAMLARILYVALIRQEQLARREALLARSGRRLLGQTQAAAVHAIIADTAADLVTATPGMALLLLHRSGPDVIVDAAFGLPHALGNSVLPVGSIARLDADDTRQMIRLDGDTDDIDELVGEQRAWYGTGVGSPVTERFILVSCDRHNQAEIFDVVRTLAAQTALAETNCLGAIELPPAADPDPLTAIPGRTVFFQRLATALEESGGEESRIAVLIIDLDDVKEINDAYGHGTGDELLSEIATRLAAVVATGGVAARFGGDEFAVMLPDVASPAAARGFAEKLQRRLAEPAQLTADTISVGASVGLALGQPGMTAPDLIRCADIAMYSAKARGKNRVEEYTEERYGGIAQVRALEEHLAHAVAGREIVLHYQPMIDLKTGHCVGVEALARWQHPTLGLLKPAAFIPLAERGGYAVELGNSVLNAACHQAMAWSQVPGAENLRVAVNVAGHQLVEPGFVQAVVDQLIDSGLPAQRLTLECTESEVLVDPLAQSQLISLAELGVRIALDDFGAGYASLANLHAVPVHQLKIDRALLLKRDEIRADAMVELIMSVSHYLGLETVAEAVETPEHADWARRTGIQLAHGYLFAEAMPPGDFIAWLTGTDLPKGTTPATIAAGDLPGALPGAIPGILPGSAPGGMPPEVQGESAANAPYSSPQ
jgi:diguanylate cyclase (GGDEF)-like protein